jgi:hypothetical protein
VLRSSRQRRRSSVRSKRCHHWPPGRPLSTIRCAQQDGFRMHVKAAHAPLLTTGSQILDCTI